MKTKCSRFICTVLLLSLPGPSDSEVNPIDFVPLEVGNRWTYKHYYWNESYDALGSDGNTPEYVKSLEIPGYPYDGELHPPDSLTWVDGRTLTIEITHKEMIDGQEYFVFSGADYDWPPLPHYFWGGRKVRLSEEGVLIFRWNERDVPLYDFVSQPPDGSALSVGSSFLNSEYDLFCVRESPWCGVWRELKTERDRITTIRFRGTFSSPGGSWLVEFLRGYGVGGCFIRALPFNGGYTIFGVDIEPVSATISGREISYEDALEGVVSTSVQPTSWGHLKRDWFETE